MLDFSTLNLWQHQLDAVGVCQSYRLSGSSMSALIHLPTGAGKTGIMATAARIAAETKPVLIVCPSSALVDQLQTQFTSAFWEKIGAAPDWHFSRARRLYLSTAVEILAEIQKATPPPLAVFATIQALQDIYASAHYSNFVGAFSLVIFDEGHREPAPQWAKAVRDLSAPTILFSATPYRNDFKLFEVDPDHISFLSFSDAANTGLIRPVEIQEIALSENAGHFADTVIAERDRLLAIGALLAHHKVIVRAESEPEVESLYQAFVARLRGRNLGVLALHHSFKDVQEVGGRQLGQVPLNLADQAECFLIHQNMLIEGIDDPACTVLVIYSMFGNERQLVQQIGRLTRIDDPRGNVPKAWVFGRPGDAPARMWARFLAYDAACVANGGRPPLRDSSFIDALIAATPAIDYIDGQFRSRLDFGSTGINGELRIPRSVVVYGTDDTFDIQDFLEDLDQALEDEDRVPRGNYLAADGRFAYRLTVSLRQSPFLAESLFQSASLELTAVARVGNRLYVYDSAGLSVDELRGVDGRVAAETFRSLIPADSRVSTITVRNTDLGLYALRGRTLVARSVESAGVFMGEQTHVVTRAGGIVNKAKRNVGFATSRVRDGEGASSSVEEFIKWCETVNTALDAAKPAAGLFSRFASPISAPADTTPLNILVDLDDEDGRYIDDEGTAVRFDPESLCQDIAATAGGPSSYKHAFQMAINGETLTVWIKWDAKKRKYWLKSNELSRIYEKANPKVTLASRLNRTQPFRIILAGDSVFAYGQFYSVDLKLGQKSGPGALVLGLLTGVSALNTVGSEKGDLTAKAATWPANSLFGIIDTALAPAAAAQPFGQSFAALVCDDIGDEAADFIGVDEAGDGRVSLLVAKWKAGKPGAGASGLYDVCGQALKNLAFMKTDAQSLPGSLNKFDKAWTLNNGQVDRIRRGATTSKGFRALFARVRSRPTARREIWLVLAQGILSKKSVEDAFKKQPPEPHVLQMFHLLLAVHASCQSVGVELKVFCSQ